MFAVPGWSVSADTLKVETASKSNASSSANKSKKRKRGGAASEEVTSSNVADLFESVVEGKKSGAPKPEKGPKRQKKDRKSDDKVKGKKQDVNENEPSEPSSGGAKDNKPKKEKKDKKQQKQDAQQHHGEKDTSDSKPASDAVAKAPAPLGPAPPKLTPLQASMRQKLISARFRHLNETLYTKPSEEAFSLFQESPEMFDEYHEGFRRQVKVWPENPVDSFLADIRRRGKVRAPPGKGGPGKKPAPSSASSGPLPRTAGTCTIADLGCGDARLAESLQSDKAKLRLQINSYDLQSPSPLVTKADIANLPLADGSVNVAIFCLALMGTNWVDFVEEAYRILHWKGELWIAEIKSRFGPVRNKNAPVTHSVGNRRKNAKKGKGGGDDEGAFDDDLAVEVDGMDDRRRETDVSAFVEVLQKRGFVLKGERKEAIDLSNRMFVKMHFIKGAAPTKGKGVKAEDQSKPPKRGMMRRDLTKDDDEEDGNEASILKPCVYKIR